MNIFVSKNSDRICFSSEIYSPSLYIGNSKTDIVYKKISHILHTWFWHYDIFKENEINSYRYDLKL